MQVIKLSKIKNVDKWLDENYYQKLKDVSLCVNESDVVFMDRISGGVTMIKFSKKTIKYYQLMRALVS